MRAMVLREFGQRLSLEELPTPKPRGAEVLLKVRAAGVCGTDLKIARGRNRRAKLPRVLCHEFAGEYVALPEANLIPIPDMKELRPIVSARMALEQVNEAIDLLGTGEVIGRIVLIP